MKMKSISAESIITLLSGVFFLYISRSNTWALGVLIAPVLMIRFLRTQKLGAGFLVLAVTTSLAIIFAFSGLKGSMFNSSISFYVVMTVSTLIGLIPMALDRYYALRIPSWTFTLIYPSLKTFLEFAGSLNSPFGEWGSSSALFAGWLPISQIVSVTGIWGLSFVLCWFASLLNFAWDNGFVVKRIKVPVVIYLLVVAGITGYGTLRLLSKPVPQKVRVAAVLADASLQKPVKKTFYSGIHSFIKKEMPTDSMRYFKDGFRKNNDFLLDETREAAKRGARIIFWAEGNGMVLKEDEPVLLEQGAMMAAQASVYLGMSVEVFNQRSEFPVENKIILFRPDGAIAWEYYKRYPIGLENESMVVGDGNIKTIQTPYGKLAAVICFDTDFISFARKVGQAGADILFAPSSDWEAIAAMRGKITRFRAVENGVTLVRPTSYGVTEMIDNRGRIISANDYFKNPETLIIADVPVKGTQTMYAYAGDWFALVSLLIFLLLIINFRYKKTKHRRANLLTVVMLLMVIHISPALQAQTEKNTDDVTSENKIVLFPAISYAPETSVALGANAVKLFRTDNSRRLQISLTGLYTFKNQFLIESVSQVYFTDNQYLAKAKFNFNKCPENYYGIGNTTSENAKNLVTYHVLKLEGSVLKKIWKNFYGGPKIFFSDYYHVFGEKELVDEMGAKGGLTTGIGLDVVYDLRDNLLAPSEGFYADMSLVWNSRSFGGDFNYTALEADIRKYFPVTGKTVIAFQALAQLKDGDVPFLQLSYLGGSSLMRGYNAGRYRDNDLIAAQVELRQRLSHKWGGVLFAGSGKVMESVSNFNMGDLHTSFGAGLRRRLSKTDRINLRIDAGVGGGKVNFYVNIAEAF